MASEATRGAFDRFRASHPARGYKPGSVTHDDQLIEMTMQDGREVWTDGPVSDQNHDCSPGEQNFNLDASKLRQRRLWIVMPNEVATAEEKCDFGAHLHAGVIKHTNLSGGKQAHSAGELILLNAKTVVVNGRSNRYGPRCPAELLEAALAFKGSGYDVWSMGWDDDQDLPAPFLGKAAERIAL